MYRTSVRRSFSPDSPASSPNHDRSRRSWSRGRSPSRTKHSPPRRGRSPGRHRSRSRGRRSRSRTGTSHRSKSRPRSKSRHRSPYSRRSYEGRDKRRYSPSYKTRSPRGSPSPDRHPTRDRSGGGKEWSSGDSRGRSGYSASPRPTEEPLPMPKKSILKKRTDVDTTSQDKLPAVDSYSSLVNLKSLSSSLANVGSVPPGDMKSSSISPSIVLKSSSVLVSGISPSPAAAGGKSLITKEELTSKCTLNHMPVGSASDIQNRPTAPSSAGNFMSLLNTKESLGIPFASTTMSFLNTKEIIKNPSPGGGRFLNEQAKANEQKQRSLSEIEEEERFLYGDEDDKPPEPSKELSKQTPSAKVEPKNNPDEKEYAKIHDLLKTIGLDIGVAEIGKLAVRTQERLHGKKAIPKVSQTPPELPQKTATSLSESSGKPEAAQKGNFGGTDGSVRLPLKETPSAVPQHSGSTVKEKISSVRKEMTDREESQPTSKAETMGQLISTMHASSVSSIQAINTVQPISTIQPPPVTSVPEMTPPHISPSQVPFYSTYTTSPIVPNFAVPPPTYNPYTPYVTYPASSWTMYPPPPVHQPPPTHITPPISSAHLTPAPTVHNPRSNLRIIETNADLTDAKNEVKTPMSTTGLLAKHEAERRNKEAEKLKVLDELEGLKKEVKAKTLNLENLSAKAEQLRVQHGILLRKKRREKDGHKDPLLEELTNVLDSARKQISSLTKEISETKQKQQQLIKVAEILGASPMDLAEKKETSKEREKSPASPALTRETNIDAKSSSQDLKEKNDLKTNKDLSPTKDKKGDVKSNSASKPDSVKMSGEAAHSVSSPHLSGKEEEEDDDVKPKPSPRLSSDKKDNSECNSPSSSKSEDVLKSQDTSRSKSPRSSAPAVKVSPKKEKTSLFEIGDLFEYYDSGGHWCEDCNSICMTLPEFLLHFHDRKHVESLKEQKKPWVKKKEPKFSSSKKKSKMNIPLKGVEFMVPTKGFYCSLCYQSFADHVEADEHLRTYAHNEKFKKYTDDNHDYEVSRRERKKASLSAAQEAARKQSEQKRKQQNEERSRSKKYKRDHEEERSSSKRRSRTSISPVKSDSKQKSKTPDKEPVKSSMFGKFTWKSPENKNQAAGNTQKDEGAAVKEKEEEAKGPTVKQKGIEIKLLGKPNNSQSNNNTTSTSTPSLSTATLSISSIAACFTTTTSSTTQATTRFKVRPNLPVPLALLRKSCTTISKPAPLNTFLSIKSASATSKSLPVVKSTAPTVLPEDIVSKAFEGEEVVLKGTQETKPKPIATVKEKDKTDGNTVPVSKPPPQTSTSQPHRSGGLYDMLFNRKDTVNPSNQGAKAKSEQDRKAAPPTKPLTPASATNPSKTISSISNKLAQSKGSEKTQIEQSAPQLNQSPGHAAAPQISVAPSKNVSPEPAIVVPATSTNSTSQDKKLIGPLPKSEKGPVETKTVAKPEQEASQAGKDASKSMNLVTDRLENLPVQSSKPQETNKIKSPESKKDAVPPVPSAKQIKLVLTTEVPSKPSYNTTSKLNQKFKREPLSLPTSLFGHISDPGCKDIKITPIAAPKLTSDHAKSTSHTPPSSSSNNQSMQKELDSYYQLIAAEDNLDDLVPSEDQDTESEVESAPHKVEIPEKRIKLETLPAVQTHINPVVPNVASEDLDDSDMACEVPDVSTNNFYTSGLGMVQSSYSFSPTYGATSMKPSRFGSGIILIDKDYTKKSPTSTPTTNYTMEELEALTTCDSD